VLDSGPGPAAAAAGTVGGAVGVAVDQVRAVVSASTLPTAGSADRAVLPDYVVDVLRGPNGVVFLVDLPAMVDSARRRPDRPPAVQT
jgi:chemotaxis signal transduction protein